MMIFPSIGIIATGPVGGDTPISQSITYSSGSSDAWGCYPFPDTDSTPHTVLGCESGSLYNFFSLGGGGSITPDSFGSFTGIAFGWMRSNDDDSCYLFLCLDGSTGSENLIINGGPNFMNGKKTVDATYEMVNGDRSSSVKPKKSTFFWSIGYYNFSMPGQWYSNTTFEIASL